MKGAELKNHDSTALTGFEKRVFRGIIFSGLATALICGVLGFLLGSASWMTGAGFALLLAAIFALFWFFQASLQSLRDYGLGEGMTNLYGEERAKMMFGEDYKRSGHKHD